MEMKQNQGHWTAWSTVISYTIMIDHETFRSRIGLFNGQLCGKNYKSKNCSRRDDVSITGNCITDFDSNFYDISGVIVLAMIYIYFMLCVLTSVIGMAIECKLKSFSKYRFYGINDMEMIHFHLTHVKILSSILVAFLLTRDCIIFKNIVCFIGLISKLIGHNKTVSGLTKSKYSSRFNNAVNLTSICIMWVFVINSILITVINPNLLNPGPSRSLKVVSFNCQGLIPFSELGNEHPTLDVTKMHEINFYLDSNKPDIFMLNETWLKKSIKDSELFPEKVYKLFRLDRSKVTHPPDPRDPKKFRRNGGGVLIALRRDLDVISTKIDLKPSAEILGVTLKFADGRKIVLCSYYRVGTLGTDNHNDFKNYIRNVRSRRGFNGIIVTGDLNMPGIDWPNFISLDNIDQLFLDTFSNFELEQLISVPTHIKGNTLDLLLTDRSGLISDVDVSDSSLPCKSDHFCLNFNLKSKFKRLKLQKREVYNFKRANWDGLNSDLNSVDWDSQLNGNIETAWLSFKQTLFNLMDKHIPKIKVGGMPQPSWFDAEAHQCCREKERLHQIYKGTPDADSELKCDRYLKFSIARKKFKNLVSQKMGDSFDDDEDSGLITKKFWSYIKATSNNTRIPELVHLGDVYKSSLLDQSELFNNFFYSQFSDASAYDIEIDHSQSQNFVIDFNQSRVYEVLKDINSNKAMGPDKIHGMVLKTCARSLCKPLALLFTNSYYRGVIPTEWKSAVIVPVHKKGSKTDVENYRPISLTCIVMKVMERIIRDELMARCGHMIDTRQHGFLKNKSCTTQLTDFCDSLALSLNNNLRSDVIYFDFAKAFDSVNHDIILKKLKTIYSIDSFLLQFVSSYLSGRGQSVVIGGNMSSELPVLSGVPQGSILGPTLFVLFLNDIVGGLHDRTNILMYADDTKIWRQMDSIEDHIILQSDINYLHDWSVSNKMKFHPSKCKVLMVSKFNPPLIDVLPFVQFYYTMGGNLLQYVDSEKDLGVTVNRTLNFTEHATSLYGKANQRFGLLKRTCHFIHSMVKKRALYLAMVRSIFEHCPTVWRPSSNTVINRLECIQKRAIKWINADYSNSYTFNNLLYYTHCKQLDILPIRYRFDYHDLKLFHLIVHNISCIKLPSYLRFFEGQSRLRFTHLDRLSLISDVVPASRVYNFNSNAKRGLTNSYFYRSHIKWNQLPYSLRAITKPGEFKSRLIKYIWQNLVDCESITSDDDFED